MGLMWTSFHSRTLAYSACSAEHNATVTCNALPRQSTHVAAAPAAHPLQAMRPRLGTELEEATAEWMQAAAAARRARHAAAAQAASGRSNIVMYAAAATAAPLLGASMLLAAAALGVATGSGSVDFV